METKLGLACAIGCLMMSASALIAVGCGSDPAKGPVSTSTGGADSTGGSADGSHVGGAESAAADGGAHSDKPGMSSGARPNVDPGGPVDPTSPDQPGAGGAGSNPAADADSPDFDGVDLSKVSMTAPSGCADGFDPNSGTLSIAVGGDASVVHLAVHAGVVQANGMDCASKAGDPATADKVLTLDVTGTSGDDSVYLDFSDQAFSGCFSKDGAITIDLGSGHDNVTILGTLEADVFHAGTDAKTFVLDATGDDRVDVSVAGTPDLVLSTGAKADEVEADGVALGVQPSALPLAIYGGGAGDKLVGGAAADRLFGGIGNDWFNAGAAPAGADTFDGGDGLDTIDFSARTSALVITIGAGADDGEVGESVDVTVSVEDVYGGQAKNEITGSGASNTIWGGPADDVLDGGAGNDVLDGGAGNDTLTGDAGDDSLYGDAGDDSLDGGDGDDLLSDTDGKNTLNGGPGDGDICVIGEAGAAKGCEL